MPDRAAPRLRILLAAAAALAALGFPALGRPLPRLVWNATASSPVGLYWISPGTAPRGATALAWPPPPARALAAARRYLPREVPLVKQVAAAGGDRVCGAGAAVFINGRRAARRRATDPSGRPMPWFSGCRRLGAGDLFLLTPGRRDAFDGRYFGVTRRSSVVGRARLLWAG